MALMKVIESKRRKRDEGRSQPHWVSELECGHLASTPASGVYKDAPPKRQNCWQCKREARTGA